MDRMLTGDLESVPMDADFSKLVAQQVRKKIRPQNSTKRWNNIRLCSFLEQKIMDILDNIWILTWWRCDFWKCGKLRTLGVGFSRVPWSRRFGGFSPWPGCHYPKYDEATPGHGTGRQNWRIGLHHYRHNFMYIICRIWMHMIIITYSDMIYIMNLIWYYRIMW